MQLRKDGSVDQSEADRAGDRLAKRAPNPHRLTAAVDFVARRSTY